MGSFDVTEGMVGFNRDNQVKVWLNENFAQNHPEIEKPVLQITSANRFSRAAFSDERDMLQEVTSLIESRTEQGQFPKEFKDRI